MTPRARRRTAPLTAGRDRTDRCDYRRTYTAKYRDGSGIVREVATGCRDESAARSVLANLERRAEKVKGEVLTAAEDAVIDHQTRRLPNTSPPILTTRRRRELTAYRMNDTAKPACTGLPPIAAFDRLADLDGDRLGTLACRTARPKAWGHGPATPTGQPAWRSATGAFETGRLLTNPFAGVPKADARPTAAGNAGR